MRDLKPNNAAQLQGRAAQSMVSAGLRCVLVCAAPTFIMMLKSSAETCCMGQGQPKSTNKMRSHSSGGKSAAIERLQPTCLEAGTTMSEKPA